MNDRLPISGNVPAEIAERQSDVDTGTHDMPDFAEPEDYAGLVCKDLQQPLASLFSTRDQVLAGKRFGALNKDKAINWLLRDLAALERSLFQVWSES